MHLSTMKEWLNWIDSIHFSKIDLNLERVKAVSKSLNLLPLKPKVIIVGGTNGKGSTVQALETIYRSQGYRVGSYTSPQLYRHNEQVRINGISPEDAVFCEGFQAIKQSLKETTLTPFEYHTLVALWIFSKHELDLVLLEVGMGGRLDAVNIVDADVAIVTSIDLDHVEWLGDTREKIAREKAGIFRPGRPAICGDSATPQTLIEESRKIGAVLYQQGQDFGFRLSPQHWDWSFKETSFEALPYGMLATQNLSTALMTVTLLQEELPIDKAAVHFGMKHAFLPGRRQVIRSEVESIFDVAHNASAVRNLLGTLNPATSGKTYAVFSMLSDKDIKAVVKIMMPHVDEWFIAKLKTPRGVDIVQLEQIFMELNIQRFHVSKTIRHAYKTAKMQAAEGDRIIVFGSFHTVREALED